MKDRENGIQFCKPNTSIQNTILGILQEPITCWLQYPSYPSSATFKLIIVFSSKILVILRPHDRMIGQPAILNGDMTKLPHHPNKDLWQSKLGICIRGLSKRTGHFPLTFPCNYDMLINSHIRTRTLVGVRIRR